MLPAVVLAGIGQNSQARCDTSPLGPGESTGLMNWMLVVVLLCPLVIIRVPVYH